MSLYSIMEDVARSDVFPGIRHDAHLVRRDVRTFGMNPNEAFERLAADHPSKRFADFLLGYTSKVRSGGDVPGFLSTESGSLLRELEESWARYAARVGIVGSMMVTVFGVIPLLLMVVGVFSPVSSILGLALFTGIGVPLLTLALLYMTGRMQPAREERYVGRPLAGMALAAPAALGGVMTGTWWLGAALALFAFFVGYGAQVRGQIAETRRTEEGLSKFLKELLEYKRQEYDLSKAMIAIEAEGGFGGPFGRVLAKVATRLRAGIPLDEVKVECRSRVGRLTFLMLGEMSRSGGGTVDTVFQVSSFADKVMQMRRSASAEMKPYLFLSYVSPLLLAFGVTFVSGVLSTFGQHLQPGMRYAGTAFHLGAPPPGLSAVADVLIVVSAAALGLIGAKITDFTVKNTIGGAANVAVAVAAVVVMGALGSHSLAGLFLH